MAGVEGEEGRCAAREDTANAGTRWIVSKKDGLREATQWGGLLVPINGRGEGNQPH